VRTTLSPSVSSLRRGVTVFAATAVSYVFRLWFILKFNPENMPPVCI
jgi:hypothetical protein